MANVYTYNSIEQLPLYLNAEQVAGLLGISRAKAYTLMHHEGLHTTRIGKRLMVSRENLLKFLEENTAV